MAQRRRPAIRAWSFLSRAAGRCASPTSAPSAASTALQQARRLPCRAFSRSAPSPCRMISHHRISPPPSKAESSPSSPSCSISAASLGSATSTPTKPCSSRGLTRAARRGSLSAQECRCLAEAVRKVLRDGLKDGGTTFRDYRNGAGESGHHQEHLLVYHREGKPCPVCGRPVEKTTVGGRGTHFCPYCQS